jgi:hypothetical protein
LEWFNPFFASLRFPAFPSGDFTPPVNGIPVKPLRLDDGLRISAFGLLSDLGFRPSDFDITLV